MTPGLIDSDSDDASPGTATAAIQPDRIAPALPDTHVRVRPCSADDPMLVLVYHELDRRFEALQGALATIGTRDRVEGIHRARNATRQIRGTLKSFSDLLPARPVAELASDMAWLADALGRVRDLDVHRANLERCLAELPPGAKADIAPYLQSVAAEHARARRALRRSLASDRFARLSAEFSRFLEREPSRAALRRALGFSACEGTEQFALRGVRRLRKAGRKMDAGSTPEQLHRLRVRCKRLRYQFQSFEPACGTRLDPAIKELRRLQDALGEHHDAIVAIGRLRTFRAAGDPPGCDAACGQRLDQIIAIEERTAARALERYARAWQRFEERVRPRRLSHDLADGN